MLLKEELSHGREKYAATLTPRMHDFQKLV